MNRRHFIKSAAVLAVAGPMLPQAVPATRPTNLKCLASKDPIEWTLKFSRYKRNADNPSSCICYNDHDLGETLRMLVSMDYEHIELYFNGVFIGHV